MLRDSNSAKKRMRPRVLSIAKLRPLLGLDSVDFLVSYNKIHTQVELQASIHRMLPSLNYMKINASDGIWVSESMMTD